MKDKYHKSKRMHHSVSNSENLYISDMTFRVEQ